MSKLKDAGKIAALSSALVIGAAQIPATEYEQPPRTYPGPYLADVVKVTDSDTIKLRLHMWPDQTITVGLRINGVDTPEKFRPQCDLEKSKALAASEFVSSLIPVGSRVIVQSVKSGKYARRAVGDLFYKNSFGAIDKLADALIRFDHAVPYDGGTKTKDWCEQ
jgi:endonuclease YncB( thermonuclease family)